MSKYNRSNHTSGADVAREASEAATEVKEVVQAVVEAVTGAGSAAEVQKELGEAAEAVSEAVAASTDAVVDAASDAVACVSRFFRTKLGYQLHDPEQDKVILPHAPVAAEVTGWMETQIKAGTVIEVDSEGSLVPLPNLSPAPAPEASGG